MKRGLVFVAIAALGSGCGGGCGKRKKPEEALMPPQPSEMPAGSGSAGSGSAAKPLTGDEIAKRFEQCWAFFGDAKWDDFKSCYGPDAMYEMPGGPFPPVHGNAAILDYVKTYKATFPDLKGENQLELISGHTIVAVTLLEGTMTGAMKTPTGDLAATKNKIGLFTSQVIDVSDAGQATHEWEFVDFATMLGQMKANPKVRAAVDKLPMPKQVVIAKDDDKEKANLAAAKKVMDAFNAHDAKAFGELLADDAVWSDQTAAKDQDKKQMLSTAQAFWKSFSDVKLVADKQWAAGDYVATVGTLQGTNDGDLADMHVKKTGKKVSLPYLEIEQYEGGKQKRAWLFDQSMAFAQQLGLTPPAPAPAPAK